MQCFYTMRSTVFIYWRPVLTYETCNNVICNMTRRKTQPLANTKLVREIISVYWFGIQYLRMRIFPHRKQNGWIILHIHIQ
jgi:hypothetical protein